MNIKMSAWGNICRICSSPAEYEIFAKIPTYLHANRNEFLKWQKPINKLIEETTGLKISADDGLPKNICALCVSYLKHAVTFREQCINNALSFTFLLKYKEIQRSIKDEQHDSDVMKKAKENILIEETDLTYSNQRELDAVNFVANSTSLQRQPDKVSKALFDQYSTYEDLGQQLQFLQKLFNKNSKTQISKRKRKTVYNSNNGKKSNDNSNEHKNGQLLQQFVKQNSDNYFNDIYDSVTPTSSDEMVEENASASTQRIPTDRDIFAYKERNFIEDDVIDVEELQDAISINIPENSQERKCEACLNRFMFHETFEDHTNSCIQLKLAQFVEEVNQLILLKRKEISTHEFIRRMIFSIRKICEWLMSYYGDILLPDLPQNSKKVLQTKGIIKSICKKFNDKINKNTRDFCGGSDSVSENEIQQQIDLKSLSIIENHHSNKSKTNTVINTNNNILMEIERSEKKQRVSSLFKLKSLDVKTYHNNADKNSGDCIRNLLSVDDSDTEQMDVIARSVLAVSKPLKNIRNDITPNICKSTTNMNNSSAISTECLILKVVAHCQPCALSFETLMAFEVHNALYHNSVEKGSS